MKKLLSIILLCIFAFLAMFSFVACDNNEGGNKSGEGVQVKRYSGDDYDTLYGYVQEKDITVLEIKNVGRIKKGAFSGNDKLTEIVVSSDVKIIDAGAFEGMKALEKITLPFVGKNANSDAYLSQSGTSPDKACDASRTFGYIFGTEEYSGGAKIVNNYGKEDVTYYIPVTLKYVKLIIADGVVPMYAFNGVNQITKVEIEGATAIGENAFYNCKSLREVLISDSVKNIYKNAFNGCEGVDADWSGKSFDFVGEDAFKDSQIKYN